MLEPKLAQHHISISSLDAGAPWVADDGQTLAPDAQTVAPDAQTVLF